jgi:hypothetical protein
MLHSWIQQPEDFVAGATELSCGAPLNLRPIFRPPLRIYRPCTNLEPLTVE